MGNDIKYKMTLYAQWYDAELYAVLSLIINEICLGELHHLIFIVFFFLVLTVSEKTYIPVLKNLFRICTSYLEKK